MKNKIKNTIKDIIDYTLTNEFKALVMIMLFMFLCVSLFWGAICTVMTNDITEVATEQKEENIKLGSDDTLRNFKSKINYLQKYYHKGAFFQDEASTNSEHIYNRDFNLPTWEDKVDRSNLPSIMNKRRGNLFKKGQTKYTHLTNEDTNNFDPNFKVPDNIVNNLLKKSGGYKAENKFTTK